MLTETHFKKNFIIETILFLELMDTIDPKKQYLYKQYIFHVYIRVLKVSL